MVPGRPGLNVHFDVDQGLLDPPGVRGLFQQLDFGAVKPGWRPVLVAG